eukprot:GHVL01018965.1.p1 GENE.GHVL01018965.1~~GHVL01018965.1.p1  ORF type:complete len:1716 (+),score=214.35 GHVL01018965.1:54-5150(+)
MVLNGLKAILKKNYLLRIRTPFATIAEMVIPVLMICFLIWIRSVIKVQDIPAKHYVSDNFSPPDNFSIYNTVEAFRLLDALSDTGRKMAFVSTPGNDANELRDFFDDYLNAIARQLVFINESDALGKSSLFPSEAALDEYLQNDDYGTSEVPPLLAAIVLQSQQPAWEFSMRFNATTVGGGFQGTPETVQARTKTFDQTFNMEFFQTYFIGSGNGAYGGFYDMQSLIYSYIYWKTGIHAHPTASMLDNDLFNFIPFSWKQIPFPSPEHIQDTFVTVMDNLLAFFLTLLYILSFVRILNILAIEKETKIREGMAMMGLSKATLWLGWYITCGIIYFFQSLLMTIAFAFGVYTNSSFINIFVTLYLFSFTLVSLAIFFSAFFSKAKVATSVGSVVFFILFLPYQSVAPDRVRGGQKLAVCLSPTCCLTLGISIIGRFDSYFDGFKDSNLASRVLDVSVLEVWGFLLFDIFFFLLLGWYFDKVIPGDVGTPEKFWFLCTPTYWRGCRSRKVMDMDALDMDGSGEPDKPTFEKVTTDAHIGIQLHKLRKVYKPRTKNPIVAIVDSSLNIYEGQILALLGHNGAGKTTTISVLTGMTPPSSGGATVYGMNLTTELSKIREHVGVCPQHDVLFGILTVREHLSLFCDIKKVPKATKEKDIEQMIIDLNLKEKADAKAHTLSGGQKRRLSVGIALIGGSKVVFLDEPSTGMDPYNRRSLWDLLKREKATRTIILTTHFMEEADYLGDRIAIMANGEVKCCGSSIFLKQKFGAGYTFTCSKLPEITDDQNKLLKNLVLKSVKDSKVLSEVAAEVSFRLPTDEAPSFPEMFEELEANKDKHGVQSYAISVTTLEEVFLTVGRHGQEGDVGTIKRLGSNNYLQVGHLNRKESMESLGERDVPDYGGGEIARVETTKKGGSFFGDMLALTIKRMHASKRDIKGLIYQIVMPVVFILLAYSVVLNSQFRDFPSINLSPESLWEQPSRIPVTDDLTAVTDLYNSGEAVPIPGQYATEQAMSDYLLDSGYVNHKYKESRYLAFFLNQLWDPNVSDLGGTDTQDTTATNPRLKITTFWNYTAIDSGPVAYNEVAKLYLRARGDPNSDIIINNHPFPYLKTERNIFDTALALYIGLGFAFIPAFWGMWVVRERESKAKHLQLISGVSIPAYWLSTMLWDFTFYLIPASICIFIMLGFDSQPLIGSENIGATIALMILYGLSVGPMTYFLSFLFKQHSTAQNVLLLLYMITGGMLGLVGNILQVIPSTASVYTDYLRFIFLIFPNFCFSNGLANLVVRKNGFYWNGQTVEPFDMRVTGNHLVAMFCEAIGLMALTIAIDYALSTPKIAKTLGFAKLDAPSPERVEDSDVVAERESLMEMKKYDEGGPLVQVKGLRKVYNAKGGKGTKIAVDSVYFSVKEGDCFGYLGVNGAGKTTTLRILTGDELPTSGTASLGGKDILSEQTQVRRMLGYCPQFDALIDNLSGREHLMMYARIKGVKKQHIRSYVDDLLKRLGLNEYANRNAARYSGGNKRKLSLGISMMGNPKIIFLDEPTSGVDPASRRFLWNLISGTMSGRSVILTTHSMEECEALCNKIGIMVEGRLRCLGAASHLRAKYGWGYQLDVTTEDELHGAETLQLIQAQFAGAEHIETFGRHSSYRIPKSFVLSKIFGFMEQNKTDMHVCEYAVSETSLDQIFVKFARESDADGYQDKVEVLP